MHVAIIGNGVTGVTCALRLREQQPDWRITLISGESKYHYSRPALMYVFMGHMRYEDTKPFEDSFWEAKNLNLVRAWVTRIDVENKSLELHGQPPMTYDKLLLATGSKSNKFGWPGQDLDGVSGLWGLFDLKKMYDSVGRTTHAVIVGGGLIGIEMAEMLHSRGVHVSILIRESSYWNNILPPEESAMVARHIEELGFDLQRETELDSILADDQGRVRAVKTKDGREIACQFVGLTAGVSPNVDLLKGSEIPVGRGILVDQGLRTSIPDVYAAGDCAEIETSEEERNLIQQVWYTGKMQAEVVADNIAGGERSYDPGIWFNSAKFLDLEYHTYGLVHRQVEGEQNLYWEHPDGKRAVRIVYTDECVIGFNLMGIRWSHVTCEAWLRDKVSLQHVLDHIRDANFDPEFFEQCEPLAAQAFQGQLR